jgi:hypothetical protein
VNLVKKHLTVANVLSLTALFVALAGSAYAAVKIGPGQVKSANLAKESVTNPKLRKEAVTSGKVKNNGINSVDLGTGSVINSKLKNGAVTSNKLGAESVWNSKIAKKAITSSKIGEEAVTAGKIGKEAISAAKIQASLYAQLVRNVTYVNSVSVTNAEPNKTATALCPVGKEAISGGVRLEGELKEVAVTGSTPYAVGSARPGWTAYGHESGAGPYGDWSIVAFAVCAEL